MAIATALPSARFGRLAAAGIFAATRLGRIAVPATLALCGCALGPDFHAPAAPDAQRIATAPAAGAVVHADGEDQVFKPGVTVPGRWWEKLGSAPLDALVDQALEHSPNLRAAQATLRQSEENLRAGYGAFLPQIGASVSTARESTVFNAGHGLVGTGPYSVSMAGLNGSWLIDLFGAQRRTVEALGTQVDEQRFATLSTYLALSSGVVDAAVARAAYGAQREATLAILRSQDDQVRLAQAQFDAGVAPLTAVLALRAARASNQAALAALEQRIDMNGHLLAQLCGALPGGVEVPDLKLADLHLPPEVPDALPSELVRRRPDILAAQAQLHRASAQIGIATADLFPSLTLSGTAGFAHDRVAQILHAGTRTWSAQADLAGSLFSGGSQWFARKAAIAGYDAALAQYEQTVLTAFEQVADALQALVHDAQALDAQAEARDTARQSLRLVRANFEAGSAGYLDLVAADAALNQAQLGYAGAKAQRLQDTVALYVALGGGWWTYDAPAPARVAGKDR